MNGIYLTKEGKEEIEKEILKIKNTESYGHHDDARNLGMLNILDDILASATILPEKKCWMYPDGAIIKPEK